CQLFVSHVWRAQIRIRRDDRFVQLVRFRTLGILLLRSVTRVIEEAHVARRRRVDQALLNRFQYVFPRRIAVAQDVDVLRPEPESRYQKLPNPLYVVQRPIQVAPAPASFSRRSSLVAFPCRDQSRLLLLFHLWRLLFSLSRMLPLLGSLPGIRRRRL